VVNKYNIIYADPPWSYRDKAAAGNRGASFKYPTQSKEWIDNLPVKDLAADDCALFLWVTMPKLNECWDLIEKWGFEYKTVAFTWVKRNKVAPSWFWGMGRWTRANAELCLLATKGHPKRVDAGVHSVVDSPIRAHSQKPDEVRDRIVKLCGDIPRVELFARTPTDGWDIWGNEVESIDWDV
jgi:N6-adenosine-specific RNA methylase IME4